MFALVKYRCDNEVAIVPSAFIKNFSVKYNPQKIYEVFWSPRSDDTPDRLLKEQGKICTVDKEVEIRRDGRTPVPGYYYAKILLVADTADELEQATESKEWRRVKASSEKEIPTKCQKKIKNKTDTLKDGKRATIINLLKTTKKRKYSDSDSDSDELNILKDIENEHNDEAYEKLSKKYNNLKNAFKKLEQHSETISKLNISLQKELLKRLDNEAKRSAGGKSSDNCEVKKNVNSKIANQPPINTEIEKDIEISKENGEKNTDCSEKSIAQEENNSHFTIPEEKLKLAYLGVKEGSAGDSRFIKNLSLCIFGEEELAQSSVTGRPCNSKRNLDVKPSLCPVKLGYLREHFIQRLKNEDPKISPEEILFRTNKIRAMIAEKIATIIRIKKKKH